MTEPVAAADEPRTTPDNPATSSDVVANSALPDPYRQLVARLDEERAKMLRCASHAREVEVQRVQEGIAAGLQIAAAHAITLFEGHEARQAYLAAEATA